MKIMNRILRICVICYWAVLVSMPVEAQQTHEQYIRPVNYLLHIPDGYGQDTLKKWPLLLFLHGSGEKGDDLEKVKNTARPNSTLQLFGFEGFFNLNNIASIQSKKHHYSQFKYVTGSSNPFRFKKYYLVLTEPL